MTETKKDIEVVQVAKEVEPRIKIGDDIFTIEETLAEIYKLLMEIKKGVV